MFKTEPLKIGVALSLSGEKAAACAQVKEGFDTEAEYINSYGGISGREVQLIYQDDQSAVEPALEAVQSLIDQKVDLIIGPYAELAATSARTLAEEAGVLLIAFGPPTLNELIEDQTGYTYSFEASCGADGEADAWLTAVHADNRKNVLAVGDTTVIHQEGLQLLTQLFVENRIAYTRMSDTWTPTDTDLTAVADKIAAKAKEVNPDSIILASNSYQVNPLIKALRTLGVTAPIYGSAAGAFPVVMLAPAGNDPKNVAGDYAIGPAMVNPDAMPDSYPAKKDLLAFIERWNKKFPDEGGVWTPSLGLAYDTLHLAEQAITTANGDTPEDWAAALQAIDWTGALGHYKYSATDRIGIHGGFVQWQYQADGTFRFVRDLNSTK